jgi:THO complex subunit 2
LISNYLRLCDATTLTNLLGFKFQFYASAPQGTPESLYKTAGILLQSGLVQLTELFPHLSPADESIKADYDKVIQARDKN